MRQPKLKAGEETRTWPNIHGVYMVNGVPVKESHLPRKAWVGDSDTWKPMNHLNYLMGGCNA